MIRLSRSTALLPLAVLFLPAWLSAQETPTLPKGYVGSELCAGCHDEVSTAFEKNPHHNLVKTKWRGLQERACEACHGPGEKHAETNSADDILNPSKMQAAAVDKMCLSCNRNSKTHVVRSRTGTRGRRWHAPRATRCNKTPGEFELAVPDGDGREQEVRKLPYECVGVVPEATPPPVTGRSDGVHELPQPARQRAGA